MQPVGIKVWALGGRLQRGRLEAMARARTRRREWQRRSEKDEWTRVYSEHRTKRKDFLMNFLSKGGKKK